MDIVNYSQAGKANTVNTTQGSSPITSDNSTSPSPWFMTHLKRVLNIKEERSVSPKLSSAYCKVKIN